MQSNSTGGVNRSAEIMFLRNAIAEKSRVMINTLEGLVIRAIIVAEDDVSIQVRPENSSTSTKLNTSLIYKKNIIRICMD